MLNEFDALKFEQFSRSSFFVFMNTFKKMDVGSTILVHFDSNEIEIWRFDDMITTYFYS